jgi:16S rRNA (cytosine967-C5)-methyltransferase
LDVLSAHPRWLVERWASIYGPDVARKICEYNQVAPNPAIRVSSAKTNVGTAALGCPPGRRPRTLAAEQGIELRSTGQPRAAVPTLSLEELHSEGIQLEPGKLLSNTFIVRAGDITATRAFSERRLVIQDEGSQLVALLVGKGEAILDCCAAPGGKTRIVAERNPESSILAMELHSHRAALLRKLVPLANVQIIAADARQMPVNKRFDRILVDAPCTGTGTLARNPEIKWRLQPEDISRLQTYQTELLLSAMKQVVPGGRIVYSTCSLEPEENSEVVEKALAAEPSFRVINAREELQRLRTTGEFEWDDIDSLLGGPYLRTIPGVHPCDGFFAAILEKR